MENSQNESNCPNTADVSKRRSPRSRHKKGHTSTLSSRLHPDFNINKCIGQNSTPQSRTNPGILENNPKSFEFYRIVQLMQPTILKEYLQNILSFLQNDSKEMFLGSLPSNTEMFLVKIASENKYLLSDSFNDQCKILANRILDTVETNKYVYTWIHSYSCSNNMLVYKKIYFRDTQKNTDKKECPTTKTQITRSLDSNGKIKDKDISTGFKIHTLNATLKFIKDNNRLSLEYPDMLMEQAEFVCSLIQQNNDGDIGLGFKSLYSPLIETLKEFNKMYDFDVLVGETSKNFFRVTIRKIPKRRIVPHNTIIRMDISRPPCSESTTHNSSFTSDSTDVSESMRSQSKPQSRKFLIKQKLVQSLPHSFIKSSLQAILNFMNDPLQASLDFKNVSKDESSFLERVNTLAQPANHQHFREDCLVLLRDINKCKKLNWNIDVNLGQLNRRTKLRKVSFHKVPVGGTGTDKQQVNRQSVPERIVEVRNNPKANCPGVPDGHNKAVSTERRSQQRTVSVQNVQKPPCPVAPEPTRQRAVSTDRRGRPISAISFKSASSENKTRPDIEPMDVDNRDTELKLRCPRKNKLLEDMSTPMESDIAERMMRMMGWDGGALGTRGDGIIEPIIPALHLARGAGLGHMKQVTRSPNEFRVQFLNSLLLFLQSGESETAVSYNPPVTKNEGKFARNAVGGFNDRKAIGVNVEEEVNTMNKILERMMSDPLLLVECSVSNDKKSIRILKKKATNPRPIKKTKNKNSKTQIPETETSKKIKVIKTSLESEHKFPSTKSLNAMAYRIVFLENIREFLILPDSEKDYKYECVLNKKQIAFIQTVAASVNRRQSNGRLLNDMENEIFDDILKVAGNCYMTVLYYTQKITLQKKYYQNRFTNSALLPPPKSTDLKNTIIYTNNVASNVENATIASENQNVASDDDDIMFIEEERETIVITDSDSVNSQIMTSKSDKNEDCDISKDISNETLLLEISEGEYTSDSNEYMSDKDISELEAAMAETDVSLDSNLKMEDDTTEEFKNKDLNSNMEHQKSVDVQEFINKDLNSNLEHVEELNSNSEGKFKTDGGSNLEHKVKIENNQEDLEVNMIQNEDQKSIDVYEINNDLNSNLEDVEELNLNSEHEVKVKIENNQEEVNNNIHLIENKNNSEFDPNFTTNDSRCDSSSMSNSSKRSRSTSDDFEQLFKITKGNKVNKVCIAPKNYPKENITRDTVEKFQILISDFIDTSTYLPLLECHGVQNGGLIYSCHNENSLLWLKNLTSVAGLDLKIFDTNYCEQTNFVVQFRVNSFIREEAYSLINRLELYNPGLDTSSWKVIDKHINTDYIVITVEIDNLSLKFISENDFSMFLGIDKAKFTILFD